MKRFAWVVGVVVFLVTAFLVTVALAGQKKYEGEKMFVYAGIEPYAREQIMEYIAPALKEKWGIELVVEEMGAKAMLEKIIIMKDKPTVTICGWDDVIGKQAAPMGLTAPIDPELAPNLRDVADWAVYRLNGEIHHVYHSIFGIGLLYNEEIFEREGLDPPDSWNDLWRPELSGRVSITAPESTWGVAMLVAVAMMEGGGVENIDPGFEKLKTLLPHIHTIHTWSSELVKLMQLGEVWLGTTGSNMGPALRTEGFPARWVAPKEGAPLIAGGLSIIKNAPYQDVAHDYINLYFGLEHQVRKALWCGVVVPHERVWTVLAPAQLEELPLTPEDFDTLVSYDWGKIAEYRNDWTERFHKELPG